MTEPAEPKGALALANQVPPEYLRLWAEHNQRPVTDSTWKQVIALAQKEEGEGVTQQGIYGNVALDDLLNLADQIRSEKDPIKRYLSLAQPGPNGKIWFDILVGLSNAETIEALRRTLSKRHWNWGLELGAGTGNLSRAINQFIQNPVLLDQANSLLQIARSRLEDKTRFFSADAMIFPFPNNKFDLAVSHGLTSSFNRTQLNDFSSEVARVLQPGGSYFDSFVTPQEGMGLLEQQSLVNAKGILADLIVDAASGSAGIKPEELVGAQEFMNIFRSRGLSLGFHNYPRLHSLVIEFTKKGVTPVRGTGRFRGQRQSCRLL